VWLFVLSATRLLLPLPPPLWVLLLLLALGLLCF
jgi:hypothetical protein